MEAAGGRRRGSRRRNQPGTRHRTPLAPSHPRRTRRPQPAKRAGGHRPTPRHHRPTRLRPRTRNRTAIGRPPRPPSRLRRTQRGPVTRNAFTDVQEWTRGGVIRDDPTTSGRRSRRRRDTLLCDGRMRAVQQRGAAPTSGDSHRGADQRNNHNADQFTLLSATSSTRPTSEPTSDRLRIAGHRDGRALLPGPRQLRQKPVTTPYKTLHTVARGEAFEMWQNVDVTGSTRGLRRRGSVKVLVNQSERHAQPRRGSSQGAGQHVRRRYRCRPSGPEGQVGGREGPS